MFIERTWSFPVSKPKPVAQWVSTKHNNEGEDDESNNQKNFTKSQPELRLSVPLDGEEVDGTKLLSTQGVTVAGYHKPVKDQTNSDHSCNRNFCGPVLKDDIASHNFKRHKGSFKNEEVVPSCYTKGLIDISTSESDEGR